MTPKIFTELEATVNEFNNLIDDIMSSLYSIYKFIFE